MSRDRPRGHLDGVLLAGAAVLGNVDAELTPSARVPPPNTRTTGRSRGVCGVVAGALPSSEGEAGRVLEGGVGACVSGGCMSMVLAG
jgi:hypothetical protein